ncbi:DUF2786 domain-containing protein [Ottowia sp. VDI28]|uniref:DUF2786 domain-containing protein n=1 Tax=Ottowia sp. VDI28 TaxID=3133968 RepID=UPI003C2D6091
MTRDEALKKIKKCLALGRSANENEAGIALRQAQALMEQFGLREQDVSLADVREVKVKACSTAANAWELRLVHLVADAFGCETFAQLKGRYNDAGNYVRSRHWVFVGIDAAPIVAGYACEVLLRQCARGRLAHIAKQPRNCKPATKTMRGDAFAIGWVMGVSEKVEAFANPEKDQALLLAYIEREYGELQSGKTRNTMTGRKVDMGHIGAGYRAGQQADLHRGVGGMPERGLLT